MDNNTIIEGTVKFRDGKKWKSRWCVVRKLSPVADCIHLQLYRDSKERYKQGQTKASLSLENFLGIQSGFTLDKESNTLAIICQELIVVLAFDTREHLMQWQVKITANLGEGDQFLVQICSAPAKAKLAPGPARLLLQEFQFCLTVGVPPRLINFWQIRQLRKFGVVEGKFCFEGGSRCGRGEGLYVLVSEKPEDLVRAFYLAAEGKLFTKKRALSRNSSVMERARKHHTLRPDSRLSNGSSLESTLESPQACDGLKHNCSSCCHSREDLLSWSHHGCADLGDTVSNTDSSNRFDLKSLWNSDSMPIGRCTSCMSKLGSMSRSSTLTNTPGLGFPAWTMDRPKSCGSQKMSPSVTCSSVSLSSHSSRGSSCGHPEQQRLSAANIDHCHPLCAASGNMCPCVTKEVPPSRPPKPPHLSFLRLQSAPAPPSSSLLCPQSPVQCCCGHAVGPVTSPYGNYDVPKPLCVQRRLQFVHEGSPIKYHSQSSSEEYYDTPRKLKDSLIWEYGNYDVPPPAQPVSSTPTAQSPIVSLTRDHSNGEDGHNEIEDKDKNFGIKETLPFPFNKVKLTGQGRMPVMSPTGEIIEIPEPSYEEKLDQLLEHEVLSADNSISSSSYVNLEDSKNNNAEDPTCQENVHTNNSHVESEQNYSNLCVVQSLQNYENFKYFFSDESKFEESNNYGNGCKLENGFEKGNESKTVPMGKENSSLCCSSCGHICSGSTIEVLTPQKSCRGSNPQSEVGNDVSSSFLGNKCNSTSCLHEINMDPDFMYDKNGSESKGSKSKSLVKCSISASNSPRLKRFIPNNTAESVISSKFKNLSLRRRSNSADSTRLQGENSSNNNSTSIDFPGKSYLSNPSSTDSLCVEKIEIVRNSGEKENDNNEIKLAPLVITENTDLSDISNEITSKKFAKRSSSVPNKFFSNRDSSSSNDSGVSTGSLSLRHFGTEFFDFEMPLTTSMSSKRHHIAMNTYSNEENKHKNMPKRSKSVDPLRELTFTFNDREQPTTKSTSAEAEVPVFLSETANKDYLSPYKSSYIPDSRSTSSGTSDISDYIETLSYSSYSSLDPPESSRMGRNLAPTMKPRSGKEYQKINRNILDQ